MFPDHFPFYKQHDSADCGATCLRIIAKHYGQHFTLDYLREISHLDRDGVSLMGISDAAERIGMRTLGVKTGFSRLKQDIPLPCIAHWRQNHFIVVYRVAGGHVYVADPAVGKLRMTEQEFLEGWISDVINTEPQGVLLLLEPAPAFQQQSGQDGQRPGFGLLGTYLKPYRRLIWQLVFGLFIGSAIQLVFPFLMQALVDKGVQGSDLGFVYLVLAAQGMLFISQLAVELLRGWILLHIGTRIHINLVSDFLMKLMRLPVPFFDAKMTGDLLQRIYDNDRVERFLTSSSLMTLFSLVSLLVFSAVLLHYNTLIFGIFVLAAGLYFGWIALFLRRRRQLDNKRFEQMAENQSTLFQLINGMQDIKLHQAEQQKRWGWERIQAKLFRINAHYLANEQVQRTGAAFINEGKNILISVVAAQAVIKGDMTLGMMLAVQYIIGHMNVPLESLIQFILAAQEASLSLERMQEIQGKPDEEPAGASKVTILPTNGDLTIDNLSFRYGGPHDPLVLKNISTRILEGRTTAIVGTSGSGKTTLVKLLLGFYPPTEGVIRIGDISMMNFSAHAWRSHCGVVMQDGFIFTDTLARNIALGDEQIDRRRLLYASKVANLHAFVESLPLGYNTRIGQEGAGLSQGQRQRVLIARAVYKNPDYLFFDEATNALDAWNERMIMHQLEHVFRKKTVVVVAHRLSTVRHADHIIVLEKGELVEQGTHEALTRQQGHYFNLIKNQLELGV